MDVVTGGAGFLGRELVRRLLESGKEVRVFDLAAREGLPEGAQYLTGDIRDANAVSNALKGAEVVYHLVGVVPQARRPASEMRAINARGTRNVIRASIENGVRRVIFASSSEVYGFLEKVPCPEDAVPAPIGEYGVNKLSSELMLREAARESGLEVSILRPTTIVGPHNWDGSFEMLFKQLDSNGVLPVPGKGDGRWHVIHVSDAARAFIMAGEMDDAAGETFNLASSGDVPTHLELALELKRHAGSLARVVKIPKGLATGLLRALCAFGLSPLEPDQFLVGFSDYVLDVSKIENVLGWKSKFDSLAAFTASYDWYEEAKSGSGGRAGTGKVKV